MSGISHEWNGTVLTVTSDSGTSSCDLKGEKGDTGIRGPQGATGEQYKPQYGIDYFTDEEKGDFLIEIDSHIEANKDALFLNDTKEYVDTNAINQEEMEEYVSGYVRENAVSNAYLESYVANNAVNTNYVSSYVAANAAPAGFGFGENVIASGRMVAANWSESYEAFFNKADTMLATMDDYTAKLIMARGVTTDIDASNPYEKAGNTLAVIYKLNDNTASITTLAYGDAKCGSLWKAQKSNGEWDKIEWDNPPMTVGVEYRTTERYQGKPVYTKLFKFASAYPSASAGFDANINLIRCNIRVDNKVIPQYGENGILVRWALTSNIGISVYFVNQDYATGTIYAQAWYTKN